MDLKQWSLLEKARKLHDFEKFMERTEFLRLKRILAENVKLHRKRLSVAQERLGLEIGVDRTVISKIERQVANPSLETLNKISVYFKIGINDLFAEPSLILKDEKILNPDPLKRVNTKAQVSKLF